METISGDRLWELTDTELARIQDTLERRLRQAGDTNVVAVGFGAKVKGGRIRRRGIMAARYLVRRKSLPRQRIRRVTPQVSVRLRRGNRYINVVLDTDVEACVDASDSGAEVRARSRAATSFVMRWRMTTTSVWSWGVLSVSHAFHGSVARHPDIVHNGRRAPATLITRTRRNSRLDAALIQVSLADLLNVRILRTGQPLRSITHRSRAQLMGDASSQRAGKSHRVRGSGFTSFVRFKATDYLPVYRISGIRREAILRVVQSRRSAFAPGTSGSGFTIGGRLAALQLGTDDSRNRTGLGQSIDTLLEWAKKQLRTTRVEIVHVF